MQILLVDDHELFRSGMATALRTVDEDISILEADCIASARPVIEANHRTIDLVLLDYEMPDGNGIIFLQRIQQDYPLLPVAMLSAVENVRLMTQSLESGALGFIPKTTSTSVILPAIQLMLSGGTYIPPTMLPALALSAFSEPAQADKADEGLTERQLEVLGLIAQGLSNKEIAWRLKITEGTVKAHVSVILKARGSFSRKQLIASAG
ncbi:MAG: response regulator transcription factor [Mariprofundaceae bacterium]|nr:response regulator transcription factor [Mariprofundaceae bacterium]